MGPKHFENKARREWWSLHIEAWRRSGLGNRKYCQQQRLTENTLRRWLKRLAGEKAALNLEKHQTKQRREHARDEREKVLRKQKQRRFMVMADVGNRASQAFWAMHVEAMNWSGMGLCAYAAAMQLSPHSLRKWRDRLAAGELTIDWRAHLHPSARPAVSTVVSSAAKEPAPETRLTDEPRDGRTNRRRFTDEEKLAIVRESDAPGTSAAKLCRRHDIVTSMLFRWRVQFGFGKRSKAGFAAVTLAGASSEQLVLNDLLQPPDGMMAVELSDGRRVFAPCGTDAEAVRLHVENKESAP
ncbi:MULTISPECIES: IS66 family insertion sequence element accessory protein TnpA [unclassified Bradyrhizobium]|uniref:IS66 family insertion sequence element accessory protein TnpA n=1 Tax=unclassified Bradyrhizobium TaxID=2631580 RepID=UPI0029169A66|nr:MULTISPECIES: transposase [unclassified Bradyrhizobium]